MNDQDIIALFFERSEREIGELILKYGAAIKNVASNILKDAQDAEECCADTYLTIWNRIPPAKPKYLGAYSCRIARNLSIEGEQTLKEYAAEQGKELLFVGATLRPNEHFEIHTEAQTFVNISSTEMNILVESNMRGGVADGDAVCKIYARDMAENRLNLELPFTMEPAPVDGERVYVPVDPDAIPGMTVGEATVKKTPLGLSVRWLEMVTDQEVWYDIMKVEIEGVTYREGGCALEDDGNWYFQISMGEGSIGDTMTVRFYDWDKEPIGDIIFRKK